MDDEAVGRAWEGNAEAWTQMSRAGFDVARDLYNTPTFLAMLPDVAGLTGLDVGCGEGHNTRQVAQRGAHMTGIDIAPTFVEHARSAEQADPQHIDYHVGSARVLPFDDAAFDFVTAFMSMQDIPEQHDVFDEVRRVLTPEGFFQFSITHPCFHTPQWGWVTDNSGRKVALKVGDYFRDETSRVDEWTFGAAPEHVRDQHAPFQVPYFEHTLSAWMHMLLDSGFALEAMAEPHPDADALAVDPASYDAGIIPFFLIVRGRKVIR